jgi:predicted enzyme related to lactoylglutathione lyase
MIHYPSGIPCWVDLGSPDIDASVAFYCDLFGWEESRAEKTSGYRMFSSGGKVVSGIRPLQGELRSPQWITYISTDDAARAVHRVQVAGGSVLMETDIPEKARIVILTESA